MVVAICIWECKAHITFHIFRWERKGKKRGKSEKNVNNLLTNGGNCGIIYTNILNYDIVGNYTEKTGI